MCVVVASCDIFSGQRIPTDEHGRVESSSLAGALDFESRVESAAFSLSATASGIDQAHH